jgi:hypothetical protein
MEITRLAAVMGRLPELGRVGRLSLGVMVCGTGSERVGPRYHRGTAMEHFAGIDVSLKDSSVCVVEAAGRIMREAYTNRPLLRAIVAQWRVAIEVMRAGSARETVPRLARRRNNRVVIAEDAV